MKESPGLPTSEMKKVQPVVEGSYSEEIPPNNLMSEKISRMAFESAFKYRPELLLMRARILKTP